MFSLKINMKRFIVLFMFAISMAFTGFAHTTPEAKTDAKYQLVDDVGIDNLVCVEVVNTSLDVVSPTIKSNESPVVDFQKVMVQHSEKQFVRLVNDVGWQWLNTNYNKKTNRAKTFKSIKSNGTYTFINRKARDSLNCK
jgi:hypothetical protein